ncbi:MAG: primosomal protein N' [Deltaproteobacteria bacterium]|nr:primosomal protein N' [Deltaproteobacteria bacterium]
MKEAIEVAVPIPSEETFHYSAPTHLKDGLEIGKRVLVPFKNRKAIGFIVGFGRPPEGIILKEIIDIVDEEPLFDEKRLEFLKWIANYYLTSLGIVLKAAHPAGLGIGLKRVVKITENGQKLLDKANEASFSISRSKDKLSETERLILKTLSISEEITVKKLFGIAEGATYELLNSLRRRNLIEFSYELKSDPKLKLEKIVVAEKNVSLDDKFKEKNPAKSEILDFVLVHRRVPYSNIKEIFGDVGRHMRWLEAKGLIRVKREEVSRDPFSDILFAREIPPRLTPDQEIAFHKIGEAVKRGRFLPFLLHGVTGSGKTEVYLRVIDGVIKKGKEAVVLVPEISLTPQLVKRFRGRFGKKVAVIHSALSDGERFDAWRMARRGNVKIIIGARSAIFAPFKNLGMIVVDEEHEPSYKQEEAPCYNARDLSLVLGKMTNSVVVLGSATPSVESYANSLKEKFAYLSLPLRVEDRPLPEVEIADMRDEKTAIFSQKLSDAIKENFGERRQTILFLNRRGFSTLIICQACGDILTCPNCSISLTYHVKKDSIRCHYCGLTEQFLRSCRNCGKNMISLGMGTQKVEEEIKRILPGARIARMDRDSISGKLKLLKLYEKLEKKEIDVLVGTQMVAKGHDLPGVTLVGVISADLSLGIPDFRAGERTFQLVTQVAGRAGRGDEPGRVVVQTYNPEHPSIRFAVEQDSKGFLNEELQLREELNYPPFSRLVNLRFQGNIESETVDVAKRAGDAARKLMSNLPIGTMSILGPSPSPVYKIRNQYRWQMLLKSSNLNTLHKFSKQLINFFSRNSGRVKVSVDVDPISFS